MKKIELRNYEVVLGSGEKVDYPLKKNLAELLFHPELGLDGRQVIENDKLATKIENAKGNTILLEDEEYNRVARIIEIKRLRRIDRPMLDRILEAEDVEVKEKKGVD